MNAIEAAAAELPRVGLDDVLTILIVLAQTDEPRLDRTAARWVGRLLTETPVGLSDARFARLHSLSGCRRVATRSTGSLAAGDHRRLWRGGEDAILRDVEGLATEVGVWRGEQLRDLVLLGYMFSGRFTMCNRAQVRRVRSSVMPSSSCEMPASVQLPGCRARNVLRIVSSAYLCRPSAWGSNSLNGA